MGKANKRFRRLIALFWGADEMVGWFKEHAFFGSNGLIFYIHTFKQKFNKVSEFKYAYKSKYF